MLARVFDTHLAAIISKETVRSVLRWKLLIVASLLAALVGAGTCFAIALFLLDPGQVISSRGWIVTATLLVPLAATVYVGVFVYRHTARRRALQAAAAVLLTLLLTLTALLLSSLLIGPTLEFLPAPAISSKTS